MNLFKIFLLLSLIVLFSSCETAKKAFINQKKTSSDEFLVEKKDPLILPPNYDELPSPDRSIEDVEKISSFEKKLTKTSAFEEEEFLSFSGHFCSKESHVLGPDRTF